MSLPPQVRADYLPLELSELFGGSDLIAVGTVVVVDDATFDFHISDVFKGTPPDATIKVERYSDWPDSRRWMGYAEDQQVFLFLQAPDDGKTGAWHIRGRGGEGEMPVVEGEVYPHGVNLEGFQRQVYVIDGGELYGYRFDVETFTEALTGYLRCFAPAPEPTQACTEGDRAAYREGSALNAYLAASAAGGAN